MLLNVLLIIADDLGVDKVNSYADDVSPLYRTEAEYLPETPVIDGLAAAGVRFTDAWANPMCSPTRAALYTGRYGFRTGIGLPVSPQRGALKLEEVTLAETLGAVGYATGLFGKWHLGQNPPPASFKQREDWYAHVGEQFTHTINPLSQGWDHYTGTPNGVVREFRATTGGYYDWLALQSTACEGCADTVTVHHRTEYATDATIKDALVWIEAQSSPWLASVALHAPHSPFELPPEGCGYRTGGAPSSEAGIFEEMVECMDQRIGDLLAGITDLDDTLVIFIGDNGTERQLSEGVYKDGRGKGTLYESGVRVPLIVADGKTVAARLPGWAHSTDWAMSAQLVPESGRVEHTPVHAVDLFRTINAVGGGDATTGIDSVDLLPLLASAASTRAGPLLSEFFKEEGAGRVAVRRGDWKLVAKTEDDGRGGLCMGSPELYDLAKDRMEQRNLAGDKPEMLGELRASLSELSVGAKSAWLSVPWCG